MNWPSRRIAVILSCSVLALVGVGGVAAYAASPSREGGLHGCVHQRTGVLRVVDPARGQACRTARGYFQEYVVTLNQAAGLPGPVGPRGPRGPAGDGIESLDDLEGLPCNVDTADEGEVEIRVAPPRNGSIVQLICRTDDTGNYTPVPTPTITPVQPPMTTRPPVTTTTTAPPTERPLPQAPTSSMPPQTETEVAAPGPIGGTSS